MKRLIFALSLAISACQQSQPQQQAQSTQQPVPQMGSPKGPAGPPAGGPPPIPPYQMRAELPPGNRQLAGRSGEALFTNRCGACHLAGGMGTNLLTKQMMMAKRPPGDALLANRADLTETYVKTVVRAGKGAMPRLTRVDVTDAELDAIASHLGKAGK